MSNRANPRPPLVFIMGPTASGKTDLAMALCDRLPIDIVSVDSALVYSQMNIGTAKPTPEELQRYPHRLVNICDPAEAFSVADFCRLAEQEINAIVEAQRIPILVGGTMMYFKALLDGLADMPETDPKLRAAIAREAEEKGWPAMHQQLVACDPEYAQQVHPNHSQRISRALEVYRGSGKTMTQFRLEQSLAQQGGARPFANRYQLLQVALLPDDRAVLHERIKTRFKLMLQQGFVDEVKTLFQRGDLHLDLPSMRAVGYRQVWQYLQGDFDYDTMVEKGIAATRQLAKRQLTWLRDWPDLVSLSADTERDKNRTESRLEKNVEYILNFLATKSL